jgi:hypothetical protein
VESTAVPVSQRGPQVAAVAYDPLQAEWVTGKGAFVRTSLSNQAHYAGAGSIEPRRNRRPRGQANRLTGEGVALRARATLARFRVAAGA